MQRPTQSELDNLIVNLQTLATIQAGDKVNVTDKKFTIQKKGWQQSLARTFSRNKASAYYKPIYRLFQIAVVHSRFLQEPPPWEDIRNAFLGLQELRQTYVNELNEARKDKKAQKTLDEKSTKVKDLDTLLRAVASFGVLSTEPAFNTWIAAPRGYGIIRHCYLNVSAIRGRLLHHRQHSVVERSRLVPQQGGGEIYYPFQADVVGERMKLYVDDVQWPSGGDIAWLRTRLHNDLGMLKEISALCNQGCLGGAAVYLSMLHPTTEALEAKFLNALGMPFSLTPGNTPVEFKISAITKPVWADHIKALKIRVNITVNNDSHATCNYWLYDQGRRANLPLREGGFASSALESLQVGFSLSVLQFWEERFQYEFGAIELTLHTRPDNPGKETPAEILKMG